VFLLGDSCELTWCAVFRCWQFMVVLRCVRWARLVNLGEVDGTIMLLAANRIYVEVASGAFFLLVPRVLVGRVACDLACTPYYQLQPAVTALQNEYVSESRRGTKGQQNVERTFFTAQVLLA
jgi:hypothetical protein